MGEEPKPLQQRKKPRIGCSRPKRRIDKSRISMTPMDLLRQLAPPIALSDRSLTDIERRLDQRRERLRRLMARRTKKEIVLVVPKRINTPSLVRLERLEKEIAAVPVRRKLLTRKEFGIHMDALHRMQGAVVGLKRKVEAAENYRAQERYLARVGQIFLDAPPDVLETFIVSRRPGRKRHRRREWESASPTQQVATKPTLARSFSSEAPAPPARGSALPIQQVLDG
jgi:hypothetical protein